MKKVGILGIIFLLVFFSIGFISAYDSEDCKINNDECKCPGGCEKGYCEWPLPDTDGLECDLEGNFLEEIFSFFNGDSDSKGICCEGRCSDSCDSLSVCGYCEVVFDGETNFEEVSRSREGAEYRLIAKEGTEYLSEFPFKNNLEDSILDISFFDSENRPLDTLNIPFGETRVFKFPVVVEKEEIKTIRVSGIYIPNNANEESFNAPETKILIKIIPAEKDDCVESGCESIGSCNSEYESITQGGSLTRAGKKRILSATVRFKIKSPTDRGTTIYNSGSGAFIDCNKNNGKALILTSGHLFQDYNPLTDSISVDVFDGFGEKVKTLNEVNLIESWWEGKNKDGEYVRIKNSKGEDVEVQDTALISVYLGRDFNINTVRIAKEDYSIELQDNIISTGCDRGQDPFIITAKISDIGKFKGGDNLCVNFAPVEGRSGGPLFNEAGEVIGVCSACFEDDSCKGGCFESGSCTPPCEKGLFIHFNEIHYILKEKGFDNLLSLFAVYYF
jgi:hypothetical protein